MATPDAKDRVEGWAAGFGGEGVLDYVTDKYLPGRLTGDGSDLIKDIMYLFSTFWYYLVLFSTH